MKVMFPCDNCGEIDDHSCWIDGIEYGPYEIDVEIDDDDD